MFPVEVIGAALGLPACRVPAILQAVVPAVESDDAESIDKQSCVVTVGPKTFTVPAAAVTLCLNRLATCQIASAATGVEHVKGGNIYAELASAAFHPGALDGAEAKLLCKEEPLVDQYCWYQGRVIAPATAASGSTILFEAWTEKGRDSFIRPLATPVFLDELRKPRDLPSLVDWMRNEAVRTEQVAIPPEAEEFFQSEQGITFMSETLWARSGIILAVPDLNASPPMLKLIGSGPSVAIAVAQVAVQIKSICDAGCFQERRTRRLKLLEERRNGVENSERIEFFVHESLVGSVIGKQGENLSRVSRLHKVEVRVFPDEAGVRRIRIYGTDSAKLKRAKADLDYQYFEIRLPAEAETFVEWFLDEKSGLKELASRQNLHSLWYDPERSSIVVCGLRRVIDDFIRGLHVAFRETHPPSFEVSPAKKSTASPPTTAVQSSLNRSQSSSRSTTPLMTSPPPNFSSSSGGSRPPILDALPAYKEFPTKNPPNKPSPPRYNTRPPTSGLWRPETAGGYHRPDMMGYRAEYPTVRPQQQQQQQQEMYATRFPYYDRVYGYEGDPDGRYMVAFRSEW